MAYVNPEENIIFPYNINMSNVPKYIKIGTNLAISKSSKKKIKKEYGLNFRGKSKRQQKEMVMREAKDLRGTGRNFRNEKYAWRFLAQSYNTALKPIRKQAIARKREELRRFNVNITVRWLGENVDKYGNYHYGGSGQLEFTDTLRRKEIANWKEEMKERVRQSKQDSPFDRLTVTIINQNEVEVAKTVPLTYRRMREAGVMELDNMVENAIWCKNRKMCVPDLLQYRYGDVKGFKKITTDDMIEFWATRRIEMNNLGWSWDEELEMCGEKWKYPNKYGYSIKHIENWCKKAKVNMYALVDDNLIAAYYDPLARKRRNQPLVFEFKNNHLYPILDTKRIKSITNKPVSELKSIISNNQQKGKEREEEDVVDDSDIEIEFKDMELWNSLESKTNINYALEIMAEQNKMTFPKKNLCLYRGKLLSFKIGKTKYLIQPPPLTEDEVNDPNISQNRKKNDENLKSIMSYCNEIDIDYRGQQPQQFTKERFKEFNKCVSSYFSEDVEEALSGGVKNRVHNGKYCKFDWRILYEKDNEQSYWLNTLSYDINKCYRSVMENPIEPFMVLGFNDTIQKVPSETKPYPFGLYYIETDDNLLFHYDNWYSSGMINYAMKNTKIDFEVKNYIPGTQVNGNPLKEMIQNIIRIFEDYPKMMKLIINSIWGYLMKTESTITYLNVDEDVRRIFDTYIKVQGKRNESLMFTKYHCETNNKILYTYGNQKKTRIKSQNLPMGIQVCDQANIKLYELTMALVGDEDSEDNNKILYRNTDQVIVGYWTDEAKEAALKRIDPSNNIGGYSEKPSPMNGWECYWPQKDYKDRRYYWRNDPKKWKVLPFNDSDDWLNIITEMKNNGGGMLLGRAGTGKSYVCIEGMKHLTEQDIRCKALAFTNKATIQLKGSTIHKFMTIDKEGKLNVAWAREQAKHIDLIFVDEISMIGKDLWKILSEFKYYTGIPFILIGDYRQLPPVKDEMGKWPHYFEHPTIKYLCNYTKCELTVMKRYDIKLWNLLEDIYESKIYKQRTQNMLDTPRRATIDDLINNKNICYKNKTRRKINEMVQNKIKPDDAYLIAWIPATDDKGKPLNTNPYNQDTYLFKGAKLIMYYTTKDKMFKKNEEVEVIDYSEDGEIVITNGIDTGGYKWINNKGKIIFHNCFLPGYATTIHKSQGDTVDGDINVFDVKFLRSGYIGNMNCRRALYTALSRGKQLKNIKISCL